MPRFLLLSLGLLFASTVAAADVPDRIKIELADARFQALPREVREVCVAPDGRIWYNLDPLQMTTRPGTAENIPAFKERIATEFGRPDPQFYGGKLSLFEPDGRVWFYLPQHLVILGYDGKTWTDYVIPSNRDQLIGYCPTRGASTAGRANRYAQGAAWFVCSKSILRFDGQNWTNQVLSQTPQPNAGNALLSISPDGRTIVAALTENTTGASRFWLFENGKWLSRLSGTDEPSPSGNRTLISLAVSNSHELWLCYNSGHLECLSLGSQEEPQADVNDVSHLIAQLADDSFPVRERATRDLLALGPTIKPQLEKALELQADPEQDYRIKLILQSYLPKPATPGQAPGCEFGGVRVSFARYLFQDPAGQVGVIAQTLRDAQSRQSPGIAIFEDNQHAKAIFSKNPTLFGYNMHNECLPIAVDKGKKTWWPRNLTGESVQLLDSNIDDFIDSAPMPLFGGIQAVSADGRVFLSKLIGGNSSERIMVYSPGSPETRTILKMEKHPVQFPQFALTDDGAIWAIEREENPEIRPGGNWGGKLVRYDGKSWQMLDAQPTQMIQSLMPGKGGVLLLQDPVESILYRGDKEIGTGDLVELIEKNREVFRNSFAPDSPNFVFDPNSTQSNVVQADKAGNIWRLEEKGRLLVLVGDRWLLAHEPMVAAGSPTGNATCMMPIGDGQKIYVSDRSGSPAKAGAFFGEVKDGKITFSEAPRIEIRDRDCLKIRDAEGLPWFISGMKESHGTMQPKTVHLGPEGIREKLDFFGNPKLVDATGNLWVEKSQGPAGYVYKLWRKGEWVQELSVPNIARNFPPFSIKPGVVYAWTNQGLQQLVADAPDFKQYHLGKLYWIDNLSGEVNSLAYNKQGIVVLLMQGGPNNSPLSLGIIKLPEEAEESPKH